MAGMVSPDTGQAIGLKFHADGEGIAFRFPRLALEVADFLRNAKKILDMVAHFMGNDVGLGKIAWSPKPLGHFLEEGEIEIQLAILWAIERSHRRRCRAAGREQGARKQDYTRVFVFAA